jgi:hypothetical protein
MCGKVGRLSGREREEAQASGWELVGVGAGLYNGSGWSVLVTGAGMI